MDAVACGHTCMNPHQRFLAAEKALLSITKEDVNLIAKELCEHLSHMQPEKGVKPVAVVACAPMIDRNGMCVLCPIDRGDYPCRGLSGEPFTVSEEEIASAVEEAMREPLEAPPESTVPSTLIPRTQLDEKIKITRPQWVPLEGKALKDKQAAQKLGVTQR